MTSVSAPSGSELKKKLRIDCIAATKCQSQKKMSLICVLVPCVLVP